LTLWADWRLLSAEHSISSLASQQNLKSENPNSLSLFSLHYSSVVSRLPLSRRRRRQTVVPVPASLTAALPPASARVGESLFSRPSPLCLTAECLSPLSLQSSVVSPDSRRAADADRSVLHSRTPSGLRPSRRVPVWLSLSSLPHCRVPISPLCLTACCGAARFLPPLSLLGGSTSTHLHAAVPAGHLFSTSRQCLAPSHPEETKLTKFNRIRYVVGC